MSKSQHTLPPMARLYDAMQQNGRGLRRSSSSRSVNRPPLSSPSSMLVVPPAPPRIRRSTTESSRGSRRRSFSRGPGMLLRPPTVSIQAHGGDEPAVHEDLRAPRLEPADVPPSPPRFVLPAKSPLVDSSSACSTSAGEFDLLNTVYY
jgi:hypothetical protein